MRFLTTITPAGKGEYFAVAVVINAILIFVALQVFKLDFDFTTREVSYAVDKMAVMAFVFAGYAGLAIINCARRLKSMKKGTAMAALAVIPGLGQLFQLSLVVADNADTSGYTPYGDNPYDPDSWVPPVNSSGSNGPAVSFRGEALMLPGEDRWEDAA